MQRLPLDSQQVLCEAARPMQSAKLSPSPGPCHRLCPSEDSILPNCHVRETLEDFETISLLSTSLDYYVHAASCELSPALWLSQSCLKLLLLQEGFKIVFLLPGHC